MGVLLRNEGQMDGFRKALEGCFLSDLGYVGSRYTWSNCQNDGGFIKERLYQAVANMEWMTMFEEVEVKILVARTSDHKPLLVEFHGENRDRRVGTKGFKFEASWWVNEECGAVIQDAWDGNDVAGNPIHAVQTKLANCQSALKGWSRRKFGQFKEILKRKTKELALLQQGEDLGNQEAIKVLQGEIDTIMEQEDIKWKQRSKQNWYKEGDRNTTFFHAWASHKRKVNTIKKIKDATSREWKKEKDIGSAFVQHYESLFTIGDPSGEAECLRGMERRVTTEINEILLSRFEAEEVDVALSQMQPLKSLEPDGFTATFYQKSWPTVREDVCTAVLDFLKNGRFDAEVNNTYIALVPQVNTLVSIIDYHPISLCNVFLQTYC
jgi:hypothetical protein